MDLITEIYQFLFIASIIFMVYIVSDLTIKIYGRFSLKNETRFILSTAEKIMLWISLAIFFAYIIS